VSRHHAERHAERGPSGRFQIPNPVGVDYLLSPAAVQLVTRTPEPVHAGPDDATGLITVLPVATTGAWTTPPPDHTSTGEEPS